MPKRSRKSQHGGARNSGGHRGEREGARIPAKKGLGPDDRPAAKENVVFDDIVQKLKEQFQITRLFLFGSRARDEATEDSDYDILAVVPTSKLSRFKRDVKARIALKDIPAAIDVFIYTESEFERDCSDLGSIAQVVASEGREIALDGF